MTRPSLVRALAAALLLGVLGVPAAARAQTTREVQVPIDAERGVIEVGPDLRRELGLFGDVAGFQVARLFRLDDGTPVLEVSRLENGALVRERHLLDASGVAAFRADVAARLTAQGRTRAVERSGRTGLILAESLLGLGVYGWAVPEGLGIDNDRGFVAAYLLTAGLSYYLPYRITRDVPVSIAERNAAVWGGTRGILHGLVLGDLVNGEEKPNDPTFGETDARVRAVAMLGTSVLETVLAYQSVEATGAGEGEVAFWGAIGDFGIPFGYAVPYVVGLYDACVDDDTCLDFENSRGGDLLNLAVALGSPVLAHLSGAGARYTNGDARALRSFGLLGAQVALVPAWAAFNDQEGQDFDKPVVAALMAGSAVGLVLGDRALASRSLSGGAGALVLAGHLAGGLGALGVTYLLDGGEVADPLVYFSTSALGSVAGSLLTLTAVSRDGESGGRGRGAADGGTRFDLTPGGALLPLLGAGGRGGSRTISAPVLTIRF